MKTKFLFLFVVIIPILSRVVLGGESNNEASAPGYSMAIEAPDKVDDDAVLRCTFFQDVDARSADRILRVELTKASARFRGHNIDGFAYVKRSQDDAANDRIAMPDGSLGLIFDVKTAKILTAREYAAANTPPTNPGDGLLVRCSIVALRVAGGGMQIRGDTNFPDGTTVMITILNGGQQKTEVKGGRFQGGPFTFRGEAYPAGKYDVRIVVPVAATQPPQVRAIIGEQGERLSGPLTEMSDFGKVVRFTTSVTLE